MVIRSAMLEAQGAQRIDLPSPTTRMADDAERDDRRLNSSFANILRGAQNVARGVASAALSGTRLLLIGTAAAGAVAGVTQLALAVGALVQASLQAAGVLGLLPAALAAVKASQAAIKLGLQGMGEAMSAIASDDAAAFDEAMKGLSKSAQAFARAVRAVKPAFDRMRLNVQEALFRDLADVVQPLADTYLPIMESSFSGVARQAGIAARDVADFMLQSEQIQKVRVFGAQLQVAFGNVAAAIRPAVSALLDLVSTGSTFLPGLTQQLNQWAQGFADRIRESARSGELEAFFQRSIDTLQQLGRIASNVFGAIGNVIDAAGAKGGSFLEKLEQMTAKLKEFTGSAQGQEAFGSFFESIQKIIDALGPAFLELITILGRDFFPILADIAEVMGPVLKPLLETFGRLLQSLRPLILAIAKAFGTALEALGPFFDALAKAIDEHMPILGPMIEDIGLAFADFFTAMVPLAPLFVQLLEAILPIIPPLLQMATELLPKLFPLFDQFIILIAELVDLFVVVMPILTDVAGVILDIVIPVLEGFVFLIGRIVDGFGIMITGVSEGTAQISEIFSVGWSEITGFFTDGAEGMKAAMGGGVDDMLKKVQGWGTDVVKWAQNTMTSFANWVKSGVDSAKNWISGFIGDIGSWFSNAGSWLVDAGKNIINGLLNGLRSAAGKVLAFFTNMITDALNRVYDALGMNSPSKVFRDIGTQIGAGLILGLEGAEGAVVNAAGSLAEAAIAGANGADQSNIRLGVNGGGTVDSATPTVGTTVVNQTNVMQPGADIHQFANTVLQRGYGDVIAGGSILSVSRQPVQAGVNDQWVSR